MIAPRITIRAADLFCGAGGSSTGALAACHDLGYQLDLTAINHWPVAVETHTANHGTAAHFCEDLGAIDPLKAVPGGHLHLLVASPECTHHSNARGGKPMQDQSRASAWHITRWAAALRIDNILIENVPEFRHWGPLGEHGRPLESKRGATFRAFLQAIRSLGYRVEWRILNAADFGDATTRKRLFVMARRGSRKIHWPEPSHAPTEETDLLGTRQRWKAAREIIDWTIPGKSIFGRKKPLSPNTMRRIIAGLKRFGGPALEPFIVMLNGTTDEHFDRSHRGVDDPLPTITGGNHIYLTEPFLIGQQTDAMPRPVSEPAPTVATAGAIALVQPFILPNEGYYHGNQARSLEEPIPTVTGSHGAGGVVEPYLVTVAHGEGEGRRTHSVDGPLPTQTGSNTFGIARPFLVPVTHGGGPERCQDADAPLPTITAAICQPHISKFYGTGVPQSVEEPLDTITAKDRFALVHPTIQTGEGQTLALDIRFRMLQPHELAGAMSFPAGYKFTGNREQQVKQIGNAVPVELSKALIRALLESEVFA